MQRVAPICQRQLSYLLYPRASLLRLDHQAAILDRVEGGVAETEPYWVFCGHCPEGTLNVPPAAAVSPGAVDGRH